MFRIRIHGLNKLFKMFFFNHHIIVLLLKTKYLFNWLLLTGKERKSFDPDPDSDIMPDPDLMNMDPKHWF